jgi:AraC-like DNA-binding protein
LSEDLEKFVKLAHDAKSCFIDQRACCFSVDCCNVACVVSSNLDDGIDRDLLDHLEDSVTIPSNAIIESHSLDIGECSGDRLPESQETAYMWRHPELPGVELFRGVYKRYRAARHFHLGPAIGIVAKGAMNSYARGATHTLSTGTVFLINPEEVHAPSPVIPDGWVLRAFYFSNDFYAELSRSVGPGQVHFSELFVRNERLTQNLLSLHRSLESSGSRLELKSNLLAVFGEVAQHYAEVAPRIRSQKSEHRKVARAKEFLVDNHRRTISLEELAETVDFSPYHLLRTFRGTVGLTPHDFLTQIRVERAKQLLGLGNTISDIAVDTGFVDQAHFTRRFKAVVGVTPGKYLPRRRRGTR